jgi:hypothetical protein
MQFPPLHSNANRWFFSILNQTVATMRYVMGVHFTANKYYLNEKQP